MAFTSCGHCPQALAPFAETLEPQHVREDTLPAFVDLTRDDQDSVRLIAGAQGRIWGVGLRLPACGRRGHPGGIRSCDACVALSPGISWPSWLSSTLFDLVPPLCLACSGVGGAVGQAAIAGGGGSVCDASSTAVRAGQIVARALQCSAAGRCEGGAARLSCSDGSCSKHTCMWWPAAAHSCSFFDHHPQLPALAESLGADTASNELLPLYLQLLRCAPGRGSASEQGSGASCSLPCACPLGPACCVSPGSLCSPCWQQGQRAGSAHRGHQQALRICPAHPCVGRDHAGNGARHLCPCICRVLTALS